MSALVALVLLSIPSRGTLAQQITLLSHQTNSPIVFAGTDDTLRALPARPALRGDWPLDRALRHLLEGSGLHWCVLSGLPDWWIEPPNYRAPEGMRCDHIEEIQPPQVDWERGVVIDPRSGGEIRLFKR